MEVTKIKNIFDDKLHQFCVVEFEKRFCVGFQIFTRVGRFYISAFFCQLFIIILFFYCEVVCSAVQGM